MNFTKVLYLILVSIILPAIQIRKQLKYKEYLRLISGYSMVTAEGAMSLLDITEHLEKNNIKGVFIEMGCWKGGMSALMAMNSSNRDIWLFDSFEGIPNLRQEDFDGIFEFAMKTKLNSGELKPLGRLEASIDDARYAMQNIAKHKLEKTHYVKDGFKIHYQSMLLKLRILLSFV